MLRLRFEKYVWVYRAAAIIACVLFVVSACRRQIRSTLAQGDMEVFVYAARLILENRNIYLSPSRGGLYYIYPPLFAVMSVPLAFIPLEAVIIGWTIFNVLLVGWCVKAFYETLTGVPFSEHSTKTRWVIGFFSILLTSRFILHHLNYGQVNILIMALTILGFKLIGNRRALTGGFIIGAAIVIKPITIPFAFWLAFRKMFRASAGVAGGVVAGLLLPALAIGFKTNWLYLKYWVEHIVLYKDLRMTNWYLPINFSLQAQLYRFFTDTTAFEYNNRAYSTST